MEDTVVFQTPLDLYQLLVQQLDYNIIKQVVETYDHQMVLNKDDLMFKALSPFQLLILTDGEPTSELIAEDTEARLNHICREAGARMLG